MKKFRLVIMLILLFTGNCFAQWVDVGRYKEVSTGVSGADNGYLSKDGNFYYFKDNTSLFRLNIESGAIDTIIKPNEMGATLPFTQFVLSDDERYLFYCNLTLVKYDIINKISINANDTIIGTVYSDDHYTSSRQSLYTIAYHKKKVLVFINIETQTGPPLQYSNYGLLTVFDIDSLKTINEIAYGIFENIVISNNSDTCYTRSTTANISEVSSYITYLCLLDLNTLNKRSMFCYEYLYYLFNDFEIYEFNKPIYFCYGYLNYMPNSNKIMSYYSNTLYFFDYDSTFVDSVKITNIQRYDSDFTEKNILYSVKNSNWLFLYNIDLLKSIDSIQFSGNYLKKIQRLHEDNSFIFFNDEGAIGKVTFNIDSIYKPIIVVNRDYEEINKQITFEAKTASKMDSIIWEFSDGKVFAGQTINRSFDETGIYNVKLKLSNNNNNAEFAHDSIVNIRPQLKADFDYILLNEKEGIYKFVNKSIGSISKVLWEFSDGSKSEEFSPTINFQRKGIFSAKLTVWDSTIFNEMEKVDILDIKYSNFGKMFITDVYVSDSPSENFNIVDAQYIDNQNLLIAYQNLVTYRHTIAILNLSSKQFDSIHVSERFNGICKTKDGLFVLDENKLYKLVGNELVLFETIPIVKPINRIKNYCEGIAIVQENSYVYIDNDFSNESLFRYKANANNAYTHVFQRDSIVSLFRFSSDNKTYLKTHSVNDRYIDFLDIDCIPYFSNVYLTVADSNYLYVFAKKTMQNTPSDTVLYKISKKGEFVDSVTINFIPSDVLIYDNKLFCIVTKSTVNVYLYVIDNNLNLIDAAATELIPAYKQFTFWFQSKILLMPDKSILVLGNYLNKLVYYRFMPYSLDDSDSIPYEIGKIDNRITIAPNPTYSTLNAILKLDEESSVSVSVFDIQGNKVDILFDGRLNMEETYQTYSIANLHPGMYLLNVIINGKTYSGKFIKLQ